MKKSILLVLVYLLCQVLAALTVAPVALLCTYLATSEVSVGPTDTLLVAVMLVSFVYMVGFLWRKGYLKGDGGAMWRLSSPRTLGWALVGGAAAICLTSVVASWLSFLPDLMKDNFAALQGTWLGLACIVLLGPAVEELVYRRAVQVELSRRYTPRGVVLLSGVLFGISHINPAQVPGACLMGFLLAWLYLRTHSLVPGLLIHIVNNGLATYLSMAYPEAEDLGQWLSPMAMIVIAVIAAAVMAVAIKRIHALYPQ